MHIFLKVIIENWGRKRRNTIELVVVHDSDVVVAGGGISTHNVLGKTSEHLSSGGFQICALRSVREIFLASVSVAVLPVMDHHWQMEHQSQDQVFTVCHWVI
jgi:hypothetical protein